MSIIEVIRMDSQNVGQIGCVTIFFSLYINLLLSRGTFDVSFNSAQFYARPRQDFKWKFDATPSAARSVGGRTMLW